VSARPDRCATCAYWDRGTCHRRPPWALDGSAPCWPATKPTDWCGEYTLVAPPTSTAREQHLAKELTAAGARLGLIAEAITERVGTARLYAMADTGRQRALAEAGKAHGAQ
jgi:hypothetical protein